jgi:hypothetical protein
VNSDFSAEALEEIGLLAMSLAAAEEEVSLYCEILLLRPELFGFHPYNKPVLGKQLSDKLNLLKSLVVASGVLYGIDINAINSSIQNVRDVGEYRNTVIHGLLERSGGGETAFKSRGRQVPATLSGLRDLTRKHQEATMKLLKNFSGFYGQLVAAKSTEAAIETSVLGALDASLKTARHIVEIERKQLESPRGGDRASRGKPEAGRIKEKRGQRQEKARACQETARDGHEG